MAGTAAAKRDDGPAYPQAIAPDPVTPLVIVGPPATSQPGVADSATGTRARSRRALEATDASRRALALWPRLDRAKLRRTGGEAKRIARLVERRTALSFETILRMLTEPHDH